MCVRKWSCKQYCLVIVMLSNLLWVLQMQKKSSFVANDARCHSPASMERLQPPDRFPRVMIIGAGKAGTTALFMKLAKHPFICPGKALSGESNHFGKEVSFFNIDERYHRGTNFYLQHYVGDAGNGDCIRLDATPGYLEEPKVPMRIQETLPQNALNDLKLIVVLRDPLERILSWYNFIYFHCVAELKYSSGKDLSALCCTWCCENLLRHCKGEHGGRVTSPSAQQRSDFEKIRHNGKTVGENRLKFMYSFTEFAENGFQQEFYGVQADSFLRGGVLRWASDYSQKLSTWWEHFPGCQIFVLNYDFMKHNGTDTIDQLTEFLEIDHFTRHEKEFPHANTAESPYKIRSMNCAIETRLRVFFEPYNRRLYTLLAERSRDMPRNQPPFQKFANKMKTPCTY